MLRKKGWKFGEECRTGHRFEKWQCVCWCKFARTPSMGMGVSVSGTGDEAAKEGGCGQSLILTWVELIPRAHASI